MQFQLFRTQYLEVGVSHVATTDFTDIIPLTIADLRNGGYVAVDLNFEQFHNLMRHLNACDKQIQELRKAVI